MFTIITQKNSLTNTTANTYNKQKPSKKRIAMYKALIISWLTLFTATALALPNGKLQQALRSAVEEEAVKTVGYILDAGAKPEDDLLKETQDKALKIVQEIGSRGKREEPFAQLKRNMRIIEILYKNGAHGTHEKLSNNLNWNIRPLKDNDRDIQKFYDEFATTIEKITPPKEESPQSASK